VGIYRRGMVRADSLGVTKGNQGDWMSPMMLPSAMTEHNRGM